MVAHGEQSSFTIFADHFFDRGKRANPRRLPALQPERLAVEFLAPLKLGCSRNRFFEDRNDVGSDRRAVFLCPERVVERFKERFPRKA